MNTQFLHEMILNQNKEIITLLKNHRMQNSEITILKKLFDKIPCVIYIMEYFSNTLIYINEEIKILTEHQSFSNSTFSTILHPDDKLKLDGELKQKLIKYLENTYQTNLKNIQISRNYRLKKLNNDYIHCLDQFSIIKFDQEEKSLITIGVITDITTLKKDNEVFISIDEFNDDNALIQTTTIKETFKISPRETQIIELLFKGLSSEEISQILNISIHTVKIHRQNLLKKLNCKNTSELLINYHKKKQ